MDEVFQGCLLLRGAEMASFPCIRSRAVEATISQQSHPLEADPSLAPVLPKELLGGCLGLAVTGQELGVFGSHHNGIALSVRHAPA